MTIENQSPPVPWKRPRDPDDEIVMLDAYNKPVTAKQWREYGEAYAAAVARPYVQAFGERHKACAKFNAFQIREHAEDCLYSGENYACGCEDLKCRYCEDTRKALAKS